MNIPRWLVIVGILVVVLGVLACGLGLGRDLTEQKPPASESPNASFDRIPMARVPLDDIEFSGSCSRSGAMISVSGTCLLIVQPEGIFPRELSLDVTGIATFTAVQEIRGEMQPTATPAPRATSRAVIRVGGRVEMRVTCVVAPCSLKVSE